MDPVSSTDRARAAAAAASAEAAPSVEPVPAPGVRPPPPVEAIRSPRAKPPAPSRAIWAVGGGKGGIGKSMLAGSLGLALAREGARVILVDGDLGGANLHTCLGLGMPQLTLTDFIRRRVGDLKDVVVDTGVPNLGLIAGAHDLISGANPAFSQKQRLLACLQGLTCDYIVIDLGAGTHYNILDFFLISDAGVLVVVPEPTSIENAYRFIKASFYRKLKREADRLGARGLLLKALEIEQSRHGASPIDVLDTVQTLDPALGQKLRVEVLRLRPKIVVNQVRNEADIRIGHSMRSACTKFLGIEVDYVGYISFDDAVWQAVKRRKPVLLEYPDSRAAAGILAIAERLALGGVLPLS